MTPYLNPQAGHQQRYNTAHCRTRVKIEQMFGMLKNRFPCLKGLRVKPERAIPIIGACVTLHNIAIRRGDHYLDALIDPPFNRQVDVNGHDVPQDGQVLRNHIANTFF